MRANGVVGDIVIRRDGPRVHGYGKDEVAGEGVNRRSRDDTVRGKWPGERGRRQRCAPIGVAIVAPVIDGSENLEGVVDAVIELPRDVVEILVVAVDEAVQFG